MLLLPRSTRRAVLRAVREGALSGATNIHISHDCDLFGPETDQVLRELHPQAEPPCIPAMDLPEIDDLEVEEIATALKSFFMVLDQARRGSWSSAFLMAATRRRRVFMKCL